MALTLATLTALVIPANATADTVAAPAAIDRVCSSWQQVIPNVWAIVCLDRNGGALFKPFGELQNLSANPVTLDQFIYLNTTLHLQCGTWPSTAAPGYKQTCTNNTWRTATAPRWAAGVFWVNGVQKTLYSPQFP